MSSLDPFLMAPPPRAIRKFTLRDPAFPAWTMEIELTAMDLVESFYAKDLAAELMETFGGKNDFPPVAGDKVVLAPSLAEAASVLSRMAVIGSARESWSPTQWVALAKVRPGGFSMAMEAARRVNRTSRPGKV